MNSHPVPRLSIMIPTYNQAPFIEEAIRSALAQDYPDFEVVVSDDASTDGTFETACRILDPRVRCFRNSVNLGRVGNYRHTLYNLARGEWVMNLDGDDYLTDPHFLSAAVVAADANPGTVLVGAGNISRQGSKAEIRRPVSTPQCMTGFELLMAWRRYYFTHLASLYNRRVALDVGFYDKDIISADQESLFRLMLRGRVALLDRIAGVWRIHGGNTSRNATLQDALNNRVTYQNAAREACAKGFDVAAVTRWEAKMAGYWALDAVNTWCLALNTKTCMDAEEVRESLHRMRDLLRSRAFLYKLQGVPALKLFLFKVLGPTGYLVLYVSFRRLLRGSAEDPCATSGKEIP